MPERTRVLRLGVMAACVALSFTAAPAALARPGPPHAPVTAPFTATVSDLAHCQAHRMVPGPVLPAERHHVADLSVHDLQTGSFSAAAVVEITTEQDGVRYPSTGPAILICYRHTQWHDIVVPHRPSSDGAIDLTVTFELTGPVISDYHLCNSCPPGTEYHAGGIDLHPHSAGWSQYLVRTEDDPNLPLPREPGIYSVTLTDIPAPRGATTTTVSLYKNVTVRVDELLGNRTPYWSRASLPFRLISLSAK